MVETIDNFICLVAGLPGSGKSFSSMTCPPPIFYVDLEKRAEQTKKLYFNDKEIIIKDCLAFDENYQRDAVKTLVNIESAIKELIQLARQDKVRSVVVDGISNIRTIVREEWVVKHPNRIRPSNPGDWSDINRRTESLIFPFINVSRVHKLNCFLTAWLTSEKVRTSDGTIEEIEKIDVVDWLYFYIDFIFVMKIYEGDFYSVLVKSPFGVTDMFKVSNQNFFDIIWQKTHGGD